MNGPDFYDDLKVFEGYQATRRGRADLNGHVEAPAVRGFVGDVAGLDVLDLGCGDGTYGRELLLNGARSFTGLDGSERMASCARRDLQEFDQATVLHRRLEQWSSDPGQYDLVVSRMTLHYLRDLEHVLTAVHRCLRPGGRLVVSTEHPVVTSHYRDNQQGGVPSAWSVQDYFVDGPRTCAWLGSDVTKYHHTFQEWLGGLRRSGFTLLDLDEGDPRLHAGVAGSIEHQTVADERRRLVPMYLMLHAQAATPDRGDAEPRRPASEGVD